MGLASFNRARRLKAEREAAEAAAQERHVQEAPDGLEEATVTELRRVAAAQGVSLAGLTKKAEIVAAIREARRA